METDTHLFNHSELEKCGYMLVSQNLRNFSFKCYYCSTISLRIEAFTKHVRNEHAEAIVKLYTKRTNRKRTSKLLPAPGDYHDVDEWENNDPTSEELESEDNLIYLDNNKEIQLETVFVKEEKYMESRSRENYCTEYGDAKSLTNNEDELEELLNKWNCINLYPIFKEFYLKDEEITISNIQYLTESDLKELIPKIGKRAEFRSKLNEWKKSKKPDANKESEEEIELLTEGKQKLVSPLVFVEFSVEHIKRLLNSTVNGKTVLEYYVKNEKLLPKHREVLVNLLVDNIMKYEITLRPEHFTKLSHNITELFPNEIKAYYYTPRKPKGSPSGKLYAKYYNLKSKKQKLEQIVSSTIDEGVDEEEPEKCDELEKKRKTLLKGNTNFSYTKKIWIETFALRKRDAQYSANVVTFINRWIAYKRGHGIQLIDIDFDLLFPNKSNLLHAKWNSQLLEKLLNYFKEHVRDPTSISHLKALNHVKSEDGINYIMLQLLNAVMPPRCRFKDTTKTGRRKNKKKASITGAQQFFITHITDLDNIAEKISELQGSCSMNEQDEVQPLIITQGSQKYELHNFYVYFDDTVYNVDSLLQCIDLCFKIFHVFKLKYPSICCDPWLFLQKFIYEIACDTHSSNLLNLLSYVST